MSATPQRNTWLSGTRIAALLVLTLLLVVAAWHYATLYLHLRAAQDELLHVQSQVTSVGFDVDAEVLRDARASLEETRGHVDSARTHFKYDPLLWLARPVPVVGDQVEAADTFLTMSERIVDLGEEALLVGERVNTLRNDESGRPMTAVAVEVLETSRPNLQRMDALAQELVALRRDVGDRALLPPLHNARAQLDQELPELAKAVGDASEAAELLPALLGFEGERRYLVLAVNNLELLPGGGLVTAAGIMTVNEGRPGGLEFEDAGRWKPQWESVGGGHIEPPGPLRRYLLKHFSWNLATSNWSPDFPTWGQQALEFYELAWGPQDVDGVLAVDVTVLERLLRVTGPQSIDAERYGEVTFTADNAAIELSRVTRQPWEAGEDRKAFIGELARVLIQRVLELPLDRWDELATEVQDLGTRGHIQMISLHPHEQRRLHLLELDGSMTRVEGDYMHFNEASLNSTKLNLIIQPEGEYHIDVTELGDARHTLTLHYENTLPQWAADKDPDLVSHLMLGGLYGGYLRVFAPEGVVGMAARAGDEPLGIEDLGAERDLRWFGVFMSLPAGASKDITLSWTSPYATSSPGAGEYSLFIEKQPGTRGLCLDISVTRAGEPASDLVIVGGTDDERGRRCITSDVSIEARFG